MYHCVTTYLTPAIAIVTLFYNIITPWLNIGILPTYAVVPCYGVVQKLRNVKKEEYAIFDKTSKNCAFLGTFDNFANLVFLFSYFHRL